MNASISHFTTFCGWIALLLIGGKEVMTADVPPAIYVEQSKPLNSSTVSSWKFTVDDYSVTLKRNSSNTFAAQWSFDRMVFSVMDGRAEVESLKANTGQPYPLHLNGTISNLQWKEWILNDTVFDLRIDPERKPAYQLQAEGQGLGGHFTLKLEGGPHGDQPDFDGHLQVFDLDLEKLQSVLQLPNVEAAGRVSGRVELEWRKTQSIHLEALYLSLNEGTEGRLRYRRDGWLTGNPGLNIDLILQDQRVDQILRRPDGPNLITEAALHDLILEKLTIRLKGDTASELPGQIDVTGYGWIQKTKIPIVLTIPIRGDLDESLDILFDLILERL